MSLKVEEQMERARDLFQEHLEQHERDGDPLCEALRPDAFAITMDDRVSMLDCINRGLEAEMLTPEEHLALELVIGMKGDPDCAGWPATTETYQRAVAMQVCQDIESALMPKGLAGLLQALTAGVDGVQVMVMDGRTGQAVELQVEPESDETVDWTRYGYR